MLTVYVPADGKMPLANQASFGEALNALAHDHGWEGRFVIVPPRPQTAGVLLNSVTTLHDQAG